MSSRYVHIVLLMTGCAVGWRIINTVARNAIAHLERAYLLHLGHILNVAMARRTLDAGCDVRFMHKPYVVRHTMQRGSNQ